MPFGPGTEYFRLRTYGPDGSLRVSSDHLSALTAGEQAAHRSHTSLEHAEGEDRVQHQFVLRNAAGDERELESMDLDQALAGMERVEREVSRQLKQRYGN